MDTYSCYKALTAHERENKDYVLLSRDGTSKVIVIAPHGGGIEPGTVDIADAIAASDHSFYAFKGIKKQGNRVLHITSAEFDEPHGLGMVSRSDCVVAIHGHHSLDPEVIIGGRDRRVGERMRAALILAGIKAQWSDQPETAGLHPDNICNRGRQGQGVQLEFSKGLRALMFNNLDNRFLRHRTAFFYTVVTALRQALE